MIKILTINIAIVLGIPDIDIDREYIAEIERINRDVSLIALCQYDKQRQAQRCLANSPPAEISDPLQWGENDEPSGAIGKATRTDTEPPFST